MRKNYIISILVALIISLSANCIASEMNYSTYADSLDLAEVIDSSELSNEELENRNGKLIIERVIGVVDDAETGAGHVINNGNFYISYKGVDNISNGNVICSYFVYNPDTNYIDDIIMRFDYIIEEGKANE